MSMNCTRRLAPCIRTSCSINRLKSTKKEHVPYVKVSAATGPATLGDNMIDLEAVHKAWKSAGFFPRAPADRDISSHGAAQLDRFLHHSGLHVHGRAQHRLFPLHVRYGDKDIDMGTIVTPAAAAHPPQVDWSAHAHLDPNSRYTLVLTSPECPNLTCHWCVSNISRDVTDDSRDVTDDSRDVTDGSTNEGTTLLDYIPPVPLKGTGFYRYALVLMKQDSDVAADSGISRSSSLQDLIKELSLTPVGLSFFQSSWDDTVGPTLAHKLDRDELQYGAERTKTVHEHYSEETFLRREWEMKTNFM